MDEQTKLKIAQSVRPDNENWLHDLIDTIEKEFLQSLTTEDGVMTTDACADIVDDAWVEEYSDLYSLAFNVATRQAALKDIEWQEKLQKERERIEETERYLDDYNSQNSYGGKLCMFCGADSYNSFHGIAHNNNCIILKLRQSLKEGK